MNLEEYLSFDTPEKKHSGLDLIGPLRSLDSFIGLEYSPYENESLGLFVKANKTENGDYTVSKLSENLVAGKNTYVYDAHTYHTKVPPKAIVQLIEHFTKPSDLVLDLFCGSGMTGVAAISTNRKPILIDLSPAATFIAKNFVSLVNGQTYMNSIQRILADAFKEEMMLYGTHCRTCGKIVPMEYLVWSYGLICSYCNREFILWDVARDKKEDIRESKIKGAFNCPHCGKVLEKRKLRRTTIYPVEIGYRCCGSKLKECTAVPDEYDMAVLRNIEKSSLPQNLWFPTAKLPMGINTRQPISHGFNTVHALYTKRNLWAMAWLWDVSRRWSNAEVSLKLMFTVTSMYQRVTRLSEFRFWGGSGNIAHYNVPMIFNEQNVFKVFLRKAKTIRDYLNSWEKKPEASYCISTQSATDLHQIPDRSIDYIFTDPPFGGNINYSEMNFIWESWLNVFTDTTEEAIINRVQEKSVTEYQKILTRAFKEAHRILKDNRWFSVAFHNSSAIVWSAIQSALLSAGFKIDDTQILDKKHGTFKQFVSDNTVGYDIIIHCLKDVNVDNNGAIPKAGSSIPTSATDISHFIKVKFQENPAVFVVRYIHVRRENELDSRKLYSLWLKKKIESGELIDVNYEEFRKIFNELILTEFKVK